MLIKPKSKKKRVQKKYLKKLCVELGIFESTNLGKEKEKSRKIWEKEMKKGIKIGHKF